MTIYCGADFHARQRTICYGGPAGGEVCFRELRDDRDDVRGFYAQFTGDVVVGLEASGYSTWFVELLEGLGHQVLIGDAAEVRRRARRRQRNGRRDAELILDLQRKGEFPQSITPRSRAVFYERGKSRENFASAGRLNPSLRRPALNLHVGASARPGG